MTLPLYKVIRDDIERDIRSGQIKPGDRIPVEHDLMRQYGCARMTVHKAISVLVAEGLIERRKKAGSFVRPPQLASPIVDIPDIEVETRARGEVYAFRLLSRTIETDGGDPVLRLTGIHYVASVPMAHEERSINLRAIPEAAAVEFGDQSPGHWLLETVPWTRVETEIGAEASPAMVSRQVGWDKHTACLVVSRQTWRGEDWVTRVRQMFDGRIYRVTASLGGKMI